uniref:Receptor ligand binding region domain-containing protein n=1 Tax=Chromera velia CCMP2878 TaxID=1169474 RepID=A0A0G4FII0_9ALVE|eukprot:Cvel_3372.t1-p1 / transcript=Cvel_3372.t1 / gene=Cvel_3372 / organism=Chromera_velia_CCMP2878 / gene_product=hypothetical protein / transcript_product=hypothetical protein / location=Cvel_scaffold135:95438-109177(-) / protein_length=3133 / sequence_SO=supercontig / SO=protein_coding / is_pseudo=false
MLPMVTVKRHLQAIICFFGLACLCGAQPRKVTIGVGVITECFDKTTYPFGFNTAFRHFNQNNATRYNETEFQFLVANLRRSSCDGGADGSEGNSPLEAAGVLLAMFSQGVSAVIGLVSSATALNLVPLASSVGLPFLSTATLSELENFHPVFSRVGVASDRQQAAAITEVLKHWKWENSRKALVFSGNVYSRGLANEVENAGGQGYTRVLLPDSELRRGNGNVGTDQKTEKEDLKLRSSRLRQELMKVNGWKSEGGAATDDVAIFLFLAVMEDAQVVLEASKPGNRAEKNRTTREGSPIGEISFDDDWPGLLDRPEVAIILNDDLAANLRTGRHRMKLLSDNPKVLRGMLGVAPPVVSVGPDRFGIPDSRLEIRADDGTVVSRLQMNALTPRVYDLTILVMTVLAEAHLLDRTGNDHVYSLTSFQPNFRLLEEPVPPFTDILLTNLSRDVPSLFHQVKPDVFYGVMNGSLVRDGGLNATAEIWSLDGELTLKTRTDFSLLNFRFEEGNFTKSQLAMIRKGELVFDRDDPNFGGSDDSTIPPKDCIVCGQQCPACGADRPDVEDLIDQLMSDCRNCKLALSIWTSMEPREREGWGKIPLWMRYCIRRGFDQQYLEEMCPGSMTLASAGSESQKRFVQLADLSNASDVRGDRAHFCFFWGALRCRAPSEENSEGGYEIDVSTIGLFGTLPQSLWKLRYAQILDLSRNNFQGPLFNPVPQEPRFPVSCDSLLPHESLRALRLRGNRLNGTLEGLRGMTGNGLRELDLSKNLFTGTLPVELLTFPNISERLDFESNRLSHPLPDPVPADLERCVVNPQLARLSFYETFGTEEFSTTQQTQNSPLPERLLNHHMASLRVIRLGSARFDGDGLEKVNFTNARSLQDLDLRGNNFNPGLPQRLIQRMREFCQLSGSMPVSLDARQWGCAPGTRPPMFREKGFEAQSDDLCAVLLKKSWKCSLEGGNCTASLPDDLPSCALCAPCGVGETTEGSDGVCRPCSAGTMSNVNFRELLLGGTECTVTPQGGAFDINGVELSNIPCRGCKQGYFSKGEASCTCTPCFPGTFADDSGSAACRTCPPRTFADEFASDKCKPCPESAHCGQTEEEKEKEEEALRGVVKLETASWGQQSDQLKIIRDSFNASVDSRYRVVPAWAGLAKLKESEHRRLRSICPSPEEGFHAVRVKADGEGAGPVSLCACVYAWLTYDGRFPKETPEPYVDFFDESVILERDSACARFFNFTQESLPEPPNLTDLSSEHCPAADVCSDHVPGSLCHLAREESTWSLTEGQEDAYVCGAEDPQIQSWGNFGRRDETLSSILSTAAGQVQVRCQQRRYRTTSTLSALRFRRHSSADPVMSVAKEGSRGENEVEGAFFARCPWGASVCGVDNQCRNGTMNPFCARCEPNKTRSALQSGCKQCGDRVWLLARLLLIILVVGLISALVVRCILTGKNRIKSAERSMQAAVFKIFTTWFELFIVGMKLLLDSVAQYRNLLEGNSFTKAIGSWVWKSGGFPIERAFESPVSLTLGLDCIDDLKKSVGATRPEQIHLIAALVLPVLALIVAFSVSVLSQISCGGDAERRRAGMNRLLLSPEGGVALSAGSTSDRERHSRGRLKRPEGELARRRTRGSSLGSSPSERVKGLSASFPPQMQQESEVPGDADTVDIEKGGGVGEDRLQSAVSTVGENTEMLFRARTGPLGDPRRVSVSSLRRCETFDGPHEAAVRQIRIPPAPVRESSLSRRSEKKSFWRKLFGQRSRRGEEGTDNQRSEAGSSSAGSLWKTQNGSAGARWSGRVLNRCLSAWVVVLFLFHPWMAREFSRNVSCVHVDQGSSAETVGDGGRPLFLAMDPNLRCREMPHLTWYALAWVGLGLWTLGTLVAFAVVLRTIRFRLHEEKTLARFGFLYRHYQPSLFGWELWAMSRKILVLVPLWVPLVAPSLRTTSWLAIAVVFLWVHALAQPYSSTCFSICNRLEQHALMAFFLTVLGAQVIKQLGDGVEDLLRQGRDVPGIRMSLYGMAIILIGILLVHFSFVLRVVLWLCRPVLRKLAAVSRTSKGRFYCGRWLTSGWRRYHRKTVLSKWERPFHGFAVEASQCHEEAPAGAAHFAEYGKDADESLDSAKRPRRLQVRTQLLRGFRWNTDDVDAPGGCACLNRRGMRRGAKTTLCSAAVEKLKRFMRVKVFFTLLCLEILFDSCCCVCGAFLCWSRRGWHLWEWTRALLLLQQNTVVLRDGHRMDTSNLSQKERKYAAELICDVVRPQLQMLGGEVDLQVTNELLCVPLRKRILRKLRSRAKEIFFKHTVLSGASAGEVMVLRHRVENLERRAEWAELVRACRASARKDRMTQLRLRNLLNERAPIEEFFQTFGHLLSTRRRVRRVSLGQSTISSVSASVHSALPTSQPSALSLTSLNRYTRPLSTVPSGRVDFDLRGDLPAYLPASAHRPLFGPSNRASTAFHLKSSPAAEDRQEEDRVPAHSTTDPHPLNEATHRRISPDAPVLPSTLLASDATQVPTAAAEKAEDDSLRDFFKGGGGESLRERGQLQSLGGRSRAVSTLGFRRRWPSWVSSIPSAVLASQSTLSLPGFERKELYSREKVILPRQRILYAACLRVRALVRFVRAVTEIAKDVRKPSDKGAAAEICRMTVEDLQAELSSHKVAEQIQLVRTLREHAAEYVGIGNMGGRRPEKFLPLVAVDDGTGKGVGEMDVREVPLARYDLLWKWREFRASTVYLNRNVPRSLTPPSLIISRCYSDPQRNPSSFDGPVPPTPPNAPLSPGTPSSVGNLCAESASGSPDRAPSASVCSRGFFEDLQGRSPGALTASPRKSAETCPFSCHTKGEGGLSAGLGPEGFAGPSASPRETGRHRTRTASRGRRRGRSSSRLAENTAKGEGGRSRSRRRDQRGNQGTEPSFPDAAASRSQLLSSSLGSLPFSLAQRVPTGLPPTPLVQRTFEGTVSTGEGIVQEVPEGQHPPSPQVDAFTNSCADIRSEGSRLVPIPPAPGVPPSPPLNVENVFSPFLPTQQSKREIKTTCIQWNDHGTANTTPAAAREGDFKPTLPASSSHPSPDILSGVALGRQVASMSEEAEPRSREEKVQSTSQTPRKNPSEGSEGKNMKGAFERQGSSVEAKALHPIEDVPPSPACDAFSLPE